LRRRKPYPPSLKALLSRSVLTGRRQPIFDLILALALQIGTYNLNYTPPTENQAQVYLKKPLIATTEITLEDKPIGIRVIGYSNEQCVVYARRISGIPIHGYAGNLQPNAYAPKVGALALERAYGHISVIVAIQSDGTLVLNDANWLTGKITERVVPPTQERGFIGG